MLLNSDCRAKLCDLGLARSIKDIDDNKKEVSQRTNRHHLLNWAYQRFYLIFVSSICCLVRFFPINETSPVSNISLLTLRLPLLPPLLSLLLPPLLPPLLLSLPRLPSLAHLPLGRAD